jgi:hypothetical protein
MTETAKPISGPLESGEPKARRERASLSKVLPTERIMFDKQAEVLRAYAAVYAANGGQPVTNEKAGEIVGLSGSTISQTNAFFTDVGILTRSEKGGFIPSKEVIEYNDACQWDVNEARTRLQPIFERAWFYRCLVPRLQLSPQSQATCLTLLAGESRAQTGHNERLLNLIRFLELSGVISTSGGSISLLQNKTSPVAPKSEEQQPKTIESAPAGSDESDQHILYLDSNRQRKVRLTAPLTISEAEYTRICNWIKVALIVGDEKTQ